MKQKGVISYRFVDEVEKTDSKRIRLETRILEKLNDEHISDVHYQICSLIVWKYTSVSNFFGSLPNVI